MLSFQDELLNTKLLAPKNGTFERGNFHSVPGGIISRVSFANQKTFKMFTFNMKSFHQKAWPCFVF